MAQQQILPGGTPPPALAVLPLSFHSSSFTIHHACVGMFLDPLAVARGLLLPHRFWREGKGRLQPDALGGACGRIRSPELARGPAGQAVVSLQNALLHQRMAEPQ
eukprot:3396235-Lingulodinium_polyedra.AAC.1